MRELRDEAFNLPTSLVVCGIPYRVDYVDSYADVDSDGRPASLWGQCDHANARISILTVGPKKRPISPEQVFATLLHETMHAIFAQCKLLEKCVSDKDEERFIDTFANLWADTLVRNGLTYSIPRKGRENGTI